MPGKMPASSCSRRRTMRLSRSSSLTRRVRRRSSEKVLRRNSPSVRGRGIGPPGTFINYTRKCGLQGPGFGLRLSGFGKTAYPPVFGFAEARSPIAEAGVLMHVAVAAGFLPGIGGAAWVGDDGFQIVD